MRGRPPEKGEGGSLFNLPGKGSIVSPRVLLDQIVEGILRISRKGKYAGGQGVTIFLLGRRVSTRSDRKRVFILPKESPAWKKFLMSRDRKQPCTRGGGEARETSLRNEDGEQRGAVFRRRKGHRAKTDTMYETREEKNQTDKRLRRKRKKSSTT